MKSRPLRRRRRNKTQAFSIFLVLLAVGIGGAVMSGWYLLSSRSFSWFGDEPAKPAFPPSVASAPQATDAAKAAADLSGSDAVPGAALSPGRLEPEAVKLPELDASDEVWRAALRPHAKDSLARKVLSQPDLIRTFVTSVLEVAEGRSPNKRFDYLRPSRPFSVKGDALYARIDPVSYARYDRLVDAFLEIEPRALLEAYARFEPLFDDAYGELGYPGEDFDEQIELAIDVLLRTPVVAKSPAMIPRAKTYAFEDPELETLYPVQRQLLRMGPRNVERVQNRLRELQRLLLAR